MTRRLRRRPAGRRGRRGTTLVELAVYLGLLTSGLTVLAGLELGAQRALGVQQALIDIELESGALLGALRRDVEAASRLELGPDVLEVVRHDGRRVRYEQGARIETGPDGERRQGYGRHTALRVSLEGTAGGRPLVIVEATFTQRGAYGRVERTYRRTASPRGELKS